MISPLLNRCFQKVITHLNPELRVKRCYTLNDQQIVFQNDQYRYELPLNPEPMVIALGKSAVQMAQGLNKIISPRLIITKYNHNIPRDLIDVTITGAHPIPDQSSLKAGERLIKTIQQNSTPLILLLSGGGSSLVALPEEGLTLNDLSITNQLLLKSGAPIEVINTIRQKLSRIKGGKLKQYLNNRAVVLTLSDIVQHHPKYVASAPLFSIDQPVSLPQLFQNYPLLKQLPPVVLERLQRAQTTITSPDPPLFLIGDLKQGLTSLQHEMVQEGYSVQLHPDPLCDDVVQVAEKLFQLIIAAPKKTLIIAGGEPTVTIPQECTGKGGRAQHLALLILKNLLLNNTQKSCSLLIAGTDGDDGESGAAGATFQWPDQNYCITEINTHLKQFNSFYFWKKRNNLFSPGATGNNVGDLFLIYVD